MNFPPLDNKTCVILLLYFNYTHTKIKKLITCVSKICRRTNIAFFFNSLHFQVQNYVSNVGDAFSNVEAFFNGINTVVTKLGKNQS